MEIYNFAIDIDSEYISIYRHDHGIVLSEPAIAIVSKKTKFEKVICAGDDAVEMLSILDNSYKVIKPISNGRIVNIDICAQLINILLHKVESKSFIKKRNLVFLIPCGLNIKEQETYKNLGYILSSKNIKLITKVQAISRLNSTKNKTASMIAIMSKDYLDVAVMYDEKIVKGYTIDFGAKIIEENIIAYLKENRNVDIDKKTSNQLCDELSTILPNNNIEEIYTGIDIDSKDLVKFKISSLDLIDYYTNYVSEISDIIEVIIKSLNKDIMAELKASTLVLAGSYCKISGIKKFLNNRLGIEVNLLDNSKYASLLGIGGALNDADLINNMAIK